MQTQNEAKRQQGGSNPAILHYKKGHIMSKTNTSGDGLYLSDVAQIINEFYKEAETIGTTDAVINVIEKAYKAGAVKEARHGAKC